MKHCVFGKSRKFTGGTLLSATIRFALPAASSTRSRFVSLGQSRHIDTLTRFSVAAFGVGEEQATSAVLRLSLRLYRRYISFVEQMIFDLRDFFSVVSLIFDTGTYQPESRRTALLVLNKAACSWHKIPFAVKKESIERDAIVSTRDRTER